MALRYLATFSALLTIILAQDTNEPSPLKNANLLLTPGLLPARPLLARTNNPFDLLLTGVSGRLLRHANLQKHLCGGSGLHSACPNDVTKCCPAGGDCCGDGTCCESGYLCQKNHQEETVCCPKGRDCSVVLPINPCAIATHTKCAGFDTCCPPNKTCQLVGGAISCVDLPGRGSGNALAKRAESSIGIAPSGQGSGSTPPAPVSTVLKNTQLVNSISQVVKSLSQVVNSLSILVLPTSVKPPSTTIPAPPPTTTTPAPPPTTTTPAPLPSITTSVRPPSITTSVRPPSATTSVRPSSTIIIPPSASTRPSSTITQTSVATRPPSTTTKPPTTVILGNTPPSPSTVIKTQSPSAPTPSAPDRDPSSLVQTISQTRSKEASTTTRDGTIITQTPTTVVVAGGKSTAPITTVETSTSTSAVVIDGATSYLEIPIVTTQVITPDSAVTEGPTSSPTNIGGSTGKSSPSPAVIAGASVGGTALLAAIIFGIFLLMRNKKKKAQGKEDPDLQGIFTPPPVREPTIPVLPPPQPSSAAGGRVSTASPVSELSSSGVVAPVPRYGSIYVPPGVAELQEEAAAAVREGNATSEYYPTNIPYELHSDEQRQQMQQVYNGYPVHAQPGLHEAYGYPPQGSPPPPPQQQYGNPQQQQYMAYPGGNGGGYTRREY